MGEIEEESSNDAWDVRRRSETSRCSSGTGSKSVAAAAVGIS
jgi:hypothetical protein